MFFKLFNILIFILIIIYLFFNIINMYTLKNKNIGLRIFGH